MNRKFKKCFITGISGSGGSYMAEKVFEMDNKIKVFGSYRSVGYTKILKKKIKNIKLFKTDLKNYKKVFKDLKNSKPDLIFHFASNADVRYSFENPIYYAQNNNLITVNLLEAVRRLKLKSLIVIISTSEVYGKVSEKDIPLTEDQRFNPINPYAASKAYQDTISQIYQKSFGMNIIITRMFSYTNARRTNLFQTSFANQIIKISQKKQKILKHGNLKSVRTFLDIDDAMNAYWLTAKKGKIGEIYNIGGNKIISVKQFLDKLKEFSKLNLITKIDKKLLRPNDVTLQITKSSKFRKHTGWKPKVSFETSVKKLIIECRWLMQNFKDYEKIGKVNV